jgi:hypothetical protein
MGKAPEPLGVAWTCVLSFVRWQDTQWRRSSVNWHLICCILQDTCSSRYRWHDQGASVWSIATPDTRITVELQLINPLGLFLEQLYCMFRCGRQTFLAAQFSWNLRWYLYCVFVHLIYRAKNNGRYCLNTGAEDWILWCKWSMNQPI